MTSGRAYAIDCEMADVEDVNSGVGRSKKFPIKVTVVDENLNVVYDQLVRPHSTVFNDNSFKHGIPLTKVLEQGISFGQVQSEVDEILYGNLVVGHDVDHDLRSLELNAQIPEEMKRDTAVARMFVRPRLPPNKGWEKPKLADLAKEHLGLNIQQGYHCPTEDAVTAMKLYKKFKNYPDLHWRKL